MSLPYRSPKEERAPLAKKRTGGRGFYRDRGLPDPTLPTTVYRDRRRTPADQDAAKLGRELDNLAKQHPRFRAALYKLQHQVLMQVRSIEWKSAKVLNCLSAEPSQVEELAEDTGLDKLSVTEALEALAKNNRAEMCTRDGARAQFRSDGKPTERIYWRRGRS